MFHNILERTSMFLRYKNKKLKKSKNQNFPKGLVHGFGLKWSIFPSFCFREKTPGRCVSRYSRKKKRLSTLKKNKKFKKSKICIFLKGLVHDFGQKLASFLPLYFSQHWPGRCVLRYSGMKKHFSRPWKQQVKKVEKWKFFQRSKSMVLVKNWQFFHLYILGNIGEENVFHDIVEWKKTFFRP